MVGATVAVTGANGFIASWIVKLLLERGYNVRGTVRDPDDVNKVGHLLELPGAKERLVLYKAHLLEEGAFDAIFDGVEGVFHTASPCTNDLPEKDLLDPAIKGTIIILTAAKKAKRVKRVVLTSSIYAILCSEAGFFTRTPNLVIDESWWSDEEWCRKIQSWYSFGKTRAERAAWDFAKENDLDLVVMNPAYVVGPILQNAKNASSAYILNYLDGTNKDYPNRMYSIVNVKDVAVAHILGFETPSAEGRYLLVDKAVHAKECVDILRALCPTCPVPDKCADNDPLVTATIRGDKSKKLGLVYTPLEESLRDTVESLKAKKWLKC